MNKLTTCVRSLCISRTLFADSSNYSFRLLRHVIVLLIVPATLFAKIPIIIDSDANNEVDDQQAIGYTLFNSDIFDVRGITTNRTYNGGAVANHTAEALRIIKLCGAEGKIPLIEGADGDYNTIKGAIHDASYDGKAAVDFIIQEAHKNHSQKLILAPIGKLTNIALAFDKDPTIIPKVTVVWLGSNWPDAGEYNLENDIPSVNAVFETEVELWIPTVNYNKDFGTAAVVAYTSDINSFMPGKGPTYSPGITGRNGGTFH
ncbi:MAG: nucleoside hydrolase, partial [Fibrobacterales bacterium]